MEMTEIWLTKLTTELITQEVFHVGGGKLLCFFSFFFVFFS